MIHSTQPVRGIDHLVLASGDLAGLADFYRRLGFTVGVRNRHPWGTENHIVQFDGAFLELIGIGAGASITGRAGRQFSFGAFVRDFLAGGGGMAMLVLESNNAVADSEAFRRARIGDFENFHFERSGKNASGKDATVAFTLAFAEMQGAPRAGFFTCQQHLPQNFWNAALQHHSNSAFGIKNVVLVAEDPSDTHEFLGAFTGQREMRSTSFGLELETPRGRIEVLSPAAFRFRYRSEPPRTEGAAAVFAAVEFEVKSLSSAVECLQAGNVSHQRLDDRLVVSAQTAYGVILTFSE